MAFELWSMPSLSPPSSALWKLHSRWVQPLAQGSLLFAPNGGLQSLPREGRTPVLLFFPRLLSQRLCSGWAHWEMSSAERWELPSFPQTRQWDGGAISVVGCWEILGPQSPSSWLIHKASWEDHSLQPHPLHQTLSSWSRDVTERERCHGLHPQLHSPGLETLRN